MNFGTKQVADIFVGALNAIEAYFGAEKVWGKSEPATANWLCFTADEANSTVHLDKVGSPDVISLETSTDGRNWTEYTWSGNTGPTLTLANVGDKVYMRAKTENQTIGKSNSDYYKFVMTGKIAASGNIQTLLKDDGSRTDAPFICYYNMFNGCTSLTSAPELPATTLANSCYYNMFYNCTSLTTAPELPATTLVNYCYSGMFSGCSSLTTAPELPATTLAQSCYSSMFFRCTSLTSAPELPATTLANNCYKQMFFRCTSLTTAPELPATTLAESCYNNMFDGCSYLTTAPELPATTLDSNCYSGMFKGCTSLTTAPELPATTLANYCYSDMFNGCTSLTTAPELPATTLANYCYLGMFSGCKKLNTITLGYAGNFADAPLNAFANWVNDVASTGTFYYNGSDTTRGVSAIPTGWTVLQIPRPELCFTAEEANSTVAMKKNGLAPTVSLEYSTDGNTWSPFVVGSTTVTLANIGDKMYMRATSAGNTGMGTSEWDYNKFVMTGKIAASGNVDTLLDQNGNATLTSYCYTSMFWDCSSLTTAPELPSTTLADYCYSFMFYRCSSLTSAPELPATTLANNCYSGLFGGCQSLTTSPRLPATTLAEGCYQGMFSDCTSLKTAPDLPATTLADSCYFNMFDSCTSLTQAPELPATTLAGGCYSNMFYDCTSLKTAPELPATTLANNCYSYMFSGCSSLTTAPELPATTLVSWCYYGMFYGCSSLTTAPELPATTLADSCYSYMFYDCTNLNTIKLDYTGNFSGDYFDNWVSGVASTGTFYYGGSDTKTGVNAIPEGWVVVAPLCFTAEEANSTVHLDKFGTPNAISLETSTDGNTWTDYSWTENTGDTLTLANVGDKVYMRAKNENQTIGKSNSDYYKFAMTGKIAASGNIQTLLKSDGSRTDAPAYCYYSLFGGCQSLTTTQRLPATTLASGCYSNMFAGCTSLTSAPELPATTLANSCYINMFHSCSSLKTTPKLPATTLYNWCYNGMFVGCTSLTQAPELPATTLARGCYDRMFQGCTSLTDAPVLPATTLDTNCYSYMFRNCNKLNTITLGYTGNFADAPSNAFDSWVNGVASTGTFYYNGTDTTTGESAIPTGWTVLPIPIPRQELCFTAEEPGSSVTMWANGQAPTVSLEYSTDGNTWSPFVVGETTVTLANIGDKMYMRATSEGNTEICSLDGQNQFDMSGSIAASGNIDTLLDQNGNATLTDYCYSGLFQDCSSLTTAPELPSTELFPGCYSHMFENCDNLNTIKLGYTGGFDPETFEMWVMGVAPEGTFYYNGDDMQEGDSAIPMGWTVTPFTS